MKALHAGYVSGAVWKAVQDEQLSPDLNWKDVLTRLSHFVIDHDVGGDKVLPPELSVFENILCRGLPTLPSLYVERVLAEKTGLVDFAECGNKTFAEFRCEIKKDAAGDVFPLLGRALCAVSPTAEQEPSEGFLFPEFGSGEENSEFDSLAERDFWNGPLAGFLGRGGMQFALCQRPLDTIAGEQFAGCRVDIAVQFPGSNGTTLPSGLVLEVDGPSHASKADQIGDARRDEACKKSGFATTYRHLLWKQVKASDVIDPRHVGIQQLQKHPFLQIVNKNIEDPLVDDEMGTRVRYLALFPMAVARIQRVILELMRGGILRMDALAWNLVILDRDGLSGCGVTAAEDLRTWLVHLLALYNPNCKVPEISVQERLDTGAETPLPEQVDALLDVSVEMRYGVSRPTPSSIRSLSGIVPRVVIRSDYYTRAPHHRLSFGDPVVLQTQDANLDRELTFFLQNIFRKAAFRPKQVEIITRALKNESVIALLPTGAGKSITYQLPSLLQNGMTIVIDPIKSLMKDQVDNLNVAGISASAFINSMSPTTERRHNTELMKDGCFKFIFVSPERFIIGEFRAALDEIRGDGQIFFAYAAVDEAHCVSEWGHDFRTAYLRLGINIRKYCAARIEKMPILALTGTASFEVLDDVQVELGYERSDHISVRPDKMERENLHYRVVKLDKPPIVPPGANEKHVVTAVGKAKLEQLPGIVSEVTKKLGSLSLGCFLHAGSGSGLVFCPHAGRKDGVHGTKRIREALSGTCPKCASHIGVYYGAAEERFEDPSHSAGFDPIKTQDDFKQNAFRVLACTKAFGMGIDKPDIRFTFHHNIPPSLESFYQEAGRAGRDGEVAQCWIFYSGVTISATGHTVDFQLNYQFHATAFPGREIEEAKVFEILDENRVPGTSVCEDIASMLAEETGVPFTVKTWSRQCEDGQTIRRLYINHPDYPDAKLYFILPDQGDVRLDSRDPYPDHERISHLTKKWLDDAHRNVNLSWWDWLNKEEGIRTEDGIEVVLEKSAGQANPSVCLSFDNGYLKAIAHALEFDQGYVENVFKYANDKEDFIAKLNGAKIPTKFHSRLREVFPKIRLREHTFRAVYRLSILGVVDDFEADYNAKTLTAKLNHLPDGACLENLRAYIRRHAPMEENHYIQVAKTCEYPTELRQCLHALITFVYERIAKQRLEALKIMEQTCIRGIGDVHAFRDAVTYFFDSGFLPRLRPHLNDFTPDLVFQIIAETAGSNAQVKHLLGACIRLLPENPDNAAFRALHAYAQALLGYKDQDVKEELTAALSGFEKYNNWGRSEKHAFLIRLRNRIAVIDARKARVFDATIVEEHAQWLNDFNQTQDPK